MHAHRYDQASYAERARLRGVPEDRQPVGSPADLSACGHVGCCDESQGRHATKHNHETKHPIIEGYDPPEGWGYCYVDEVFLDLGDDITPQDGPIPRFV